MKTTTTPLQFVLQAIRPVKFWVIAAFALVFLAMLLTRVKFYLIKLITDTAELFTKSQIEFTELLNLMIIFGVIHLINGQIWRTTGFTGMRWIARTIARIYQILFNYLTGHSIKYFQNRFAGSLASKISNVASGFESLSSEILWNFFPLIIGLTLDIYLTYTAHYALTLTLLGWFSIFITINIIWAIKLKQPFYEHAEATSSLRGKIVDSASNISSVHQAPGHKYEKKYVGEYVDAKEKFHLRAWRKSEYLLVFNSAMLSFFVAAMFITSAYLLKENLITIGDMLMIITLAINLDRSLFGIGNSITRLMGEYGQITEGLDEILTDYHISESKDAKDLAVKSGGINIKNLSFKYEEQYIFKDFNLDIKPGEKLGLVGPSGAGKSTLVSLILRYFDIQEGSILIDQQDIKEIKLESLRKSISMIPQDTELFHRKIRENITYGKFDATDEEVEIATKKAQAYDFIADLPKGFETFVGERGVKLSGGQRQRVAIARAILKDSPILILDEATSALDSTSEEAIQIALQELMKNKTVIAIAHRLSTLRIMDKIVVIDDGKIIESGTHDELVSKDGLYAKIWSTQVSGFIQDL